MINQQLLNEHILKTNDHLTGELIAIIKSNNQEKRQERLLHFGCSAGYVTFNIAEYFDSVIAIDRRSRFVDACQKLNEGKTLKVHTEKDNKIYDIHIQKKQENIIFIQVINRLIFFKA